MMTPATSDPSEPGRARPDRASAAEEAPLLAPHPQEVAIVWFLPAAAGAVGLTLLGAPLLVMLGGGLALIGASAAAWGLLASRPSDFEMIVAVARGYRLKALSARRIWAPFNAQWLRPRQYRVVARDRTRQLRVLEVAFPLLGQGPAWVRLSLEGAPDERT